MTVFGYNMTDAGRGYSFEIRDDGLYARASQNGEFTEYHRLGSEDFTPGKPSNSGNGIRIEIDAYTVDRVTGIRQPGTLPAAFTLYGKTDEGTWERITGVNTSLNPHFYWNIPESYYRDLGYCGWKLVSPEGLTDEVSVKVYYTQILTGDSEYWRSLFAEDPDAVDYVQVINLARFTLNEEQEDGSYAWINPQSGYTGPTGSSTHYSQYTGLADLEREQQGYYHYEGGAVTLNAAEQSSGMKKYVIPQNGANYLGRALSHRHQPRQRDRDL